MIYASDSVTWLSKGGSDCLSQAHFASIEREAKENSRSVPWVYVKWKSKAKKDCGVSERKVVIVLGWDSRHVQARERLRKNSIFVLLV